MANSEEYNGVQKAAILLIALAPEKSASIFKHFKEEEILAAVQTPKRLHVSPKERGISIYP